MSLIDNSRFSEQRRDDELSSYAKEDAYSGITGGSYHNVDGNNESDEALERRAHRLRVRILLITLIVVLLILGVYFYWISQELDRIRQPSILISN